MKLPGWMSRWMPWSRPRGGRRRFDAAQFNRLTHSWVASERSINTELRSDLDALRRRARDLAKNAPLARKFLKMCEANIAGPRGFVLQARAADGARSDDLANAAIEAAWADWSKAKHCDVSGRLSFRQMTRAIVRAVARDGEAIVRIREGSGKYGYALQLLDIERLDTTLNREASEGKNPIIMGVEMDGDGRPVAYWLATSAIGRDPTGKRLSRVSAEEILHLFLTDDPEQVRGIPWMHASMLSVNDLKGYNHAAIVAARIGASKMGFFVLPDGDTAAVADGEDEQGAPFIEAEPGQFGVLRGEGADFKSFNPDYPHANYAAFVKEHKRDIATGWNVAYNSLANDLEGVNFSSIRSGTLEERENWMTAQDDFIEQFCDVVFEGWLGNALLSGAIVMANGSALPAAKRQKFLAHQFQGRRWQWVDPLKDIEAAVLAIRNGLASPYTIAAQQGLDIEEVLADIARFQELAKAKNVTLGDAPGAANPPADPDGDAASDRAAMMLRTMEKMADVMREAMNPAPPPAIHVTTPDVRVENHVAPAPVAAPEIRFEAAPPPVVQVDVHVPEQPAPVVEVRVDPTPVTLEAHLPAPEVTLELGARKTETQIVRNAAGEMIGSTAMETPA